VEDAVLVTGEYVETGALLSLEHLGPLAQNAILPSLQMFAKWEQKGKIRGGGYRRYGGCGLEKGGRLTCKRL